MIFLSHNFMAQENMNSEKIKTLIIDKFKLLNADYALVYHDLKTGNEVLINERDIFHAASTMKTPVMLELFKQSYEGKFNLNDSIIVNNKFKSIVDGSEFTLEIDRDGGDELYFLLGKETRIIDLIENMITVSGNLATNILIELVDPKNVMNTLKTLGTKNIKVLRGVEDIKAYDLGMNNVTDAYDLMLIFKAIYNTNMLPDKLHSEMIEILSRQKFNTIIPAKLPKDIQIAHKTGSISGVMHDSGIIFPENGNDYILVILTKNLKSQGNEVEILSDVSKIIYDYSISIK